MFKLVIQDDEGKTTVVPLIRDEITIGRKEGNTIRLTERNVSRRHARIVRANGAVAIEDLGSYNGVRVNGTRIAQRTALTVSDRVQIGDYLIELKAEGAEQADQFDAKTQPIERVDPAALARGNGAHTPTLPSQPVVPMAGMAPGMMPGGMPGGQVALADTDPAAMAVRAAPPIAPIAAVGHARLVVLSSNFAGREFELIKPQMVIGRTDDNDIVVNHRSISRNHAKIVREPDTGRYTISDLQSSNGVRVNGEEYGKVELRRGDIIDLGHVRLRFVEAGEDFLFGRDAQIVDVPTGGTSKGLVAGLLVLLVIGGGIGVFLATRGGGETVADQQPPGTAVAATSPDVRPPPVTPNPPTPVQPPLEPPTPQVTANPEVTKALDEARAAIADEKWAAALSAAKKALELDPNDETAKQLAEQAKRELANELQFRDFSTAVKQKDIAQVATLFDKLDEDSVYKEKAREAHDKMKADYTAQMQQRAAQLAKQNKCKDLQKLAEQAGRVWADAGDAVSAVACQAPVAATPDRPRRPEAPRPDPGPRAEGPKPETPKPESPKPEAPKPDAGMSVDQLVTEAETAARNNQYGKSLRLCEDALKVDKTNVRGINVCAIAACNLKNVAKAKTYVGKLSGPRQAAMKQICLRNGVSVD